MDGLASSWRSTTSIFKCVGKEYCLRSEKPNRNVQKPMPSLSRFENPTRVAYLSPSPSLVSQLIEYDLLDEITSFQQVIVQAYRYGAYRVCHRRCRPCEYFHLLHGLLRVHSTRPQVRRRLR